MNYIRKSKVCFDLFDISLRCRRTKPRYIVRLQRRLFDTVEALVSGHPRDAKKVSVTGAGRLREQRKRVSRNL